MAAIDETRRLRCVNYYLIISSHHIYFYIYIYIYIYISSSLSPPGLIIVCFVKLLVRLWDQL